MFYENEFDKIWEKIIKNEIDRFVKKLGMKRKPFWLIKWRLNHKFNKYKSVLVKNYMVLDTANIDRHKIAACMIKAILRVKPLYIPLKAKIMLLFTKKKSFAEILRNDFNVNRKDIDRLQKYYLFFNEYLALGIALSILDSYINSDSRENRFKHKMVLPTPFPEEDEDYFLDVCIGLHCTRVKNINPITYSNAFFLWEKYSCRKTQCDNLIASYKKTLREKKLSETEIDKIICEAQYRIG